MFSLLGMQLFGGGYSFDGSERPGCGSEDSRFHFDYYMPAMLTVRLLARALKQSDRAQFSTMHNTTTLTVLLLCYVTGAVDLLGRLGRSVPSMYSDLHPALTHLYPTRPRHRLLCDI